VFATLRVDAGISQPQSLHGLPANDVGFDDLIHIHQGHASIPNRFGVDHEVRTVFALVQAPGLVSSDAPLQSALFQLLLKQFLQFGCALGIAAAARVSRRPLVPTNKDVPLKPGHEENVQDSLWLCRNIRRAQKLIDFVV